MSAFRCTLNSDDLPRNGFSSGLRVEETIRLRLTDAEVAGCLMGGHILLESQD